MTRILILGGDGMLGHQLLRHFQPHYEVKVSLHGSLAHYAHYGLFTEGNAFTDVDVRDADRLWEIMDSFRPGVLINCVGLIKQRAEANDHLTSIEINALLPHRLQRLARPIGARVIHLSTDCVFSGRKGNYTEEDLPDAEDLYGRTKLLGELTADNCLTLRTSIIGPELTRKTGLFEWFIAQRGKRVQGFRQAIFSGFTTREMARIIERAIAQYHQASGLYQVASAPISKFELLSKINLLLGLGIEILPDDRFKCDRSLNSAKFQSSFNYQPPSWDAMLSELCGESSY